MVSRSSAARPSQPYECYVIMQSPEVKQSVQMPAVFAVLRVHIYVRHLTTLLCASFLSLTLPSKLHVSAARNTCSVCHCAARYPTVLLLASRSYAEQHTLPLFMRTHIPTRESSQNPIFITYLHDCTTGCSRLSVVMVGSGCTDN
jgi:hypothetical protein